MDTKPDLQLLIARKLEGTITSDELMVLEAIVATSQEAAQQYIVLEKIWKTSRHLSIPKGNQQDVRWQNLQSKIAGETPGAGSRRVLWLRYAAVAAVFIFLAVAYLVNDDDWVTINTRADEVVSITLPDSSIVKLKGNSHLSYYASDWKSTRNLRLDGDAFFEVKRTGISFIVESSNARIAVLGTSFNVNSSALNTVVTCLTGKVSVANIAADQEVILTPGLEAAVKGDAVSEPYTASVAGGLAGDLNFHRAPLKEVFKSLANHHNKGIVMPNDIDSVLFTGNLAGTSLQSALKTVCLSAGLEFTISADSVFIKSR